jgi:hypothetical protein
VNGVELVAAHEYAAAVLEAGEPAAGMVVGTFD